MRIASVDNYVIFYTPFKEKYEVVINRTLRIERNENEYLKYAY